MEWESGRSRGLRKFSLAGSANTVLKQEFYTACVERCQHTTGYVTTRMPSDDPGTVTRKVNI